MITVAFDVNDSQVRESFLANQFVEAIAGLEEHTPPLWGNMSAQHMLEHLMWTFQCSTGTIELPCRTPENLLDRTKRFLSDGRETPRHLKNPLLAEMPMPLHFANYAEAKVNLRKELDSFVDHYREEPKAIHIHPVFGPIDGDGWHRAHFKHCCHHLLQFGLIDKANAVVRGA